MQRSETSNRHVAIVGSGVSGLTAAHELVERGFTVDVFDSADRPGGVARSQHAVMPPDADPEVTRHARSVAGSPRLQGFISETDDARFVVAGRVGIGIWNVQSGRLVCRLGGPSGYRSADVSVRCGVAVGATATHVAFWRLPTDFVASGSTSAVALAPASVVAWPDEVVSVAVRSPCLPYADAPDGNWAWVAARRADGSIYVASVSERGDADAARSRTTHTGPVAFITADGDLVSGSALSTAEPAPSAQVAAAKPPTPVIRLRIQRVGAELIATTATAVGPGGTSTVRVHACAVQNAAASEWPLIARLDYEGDPGDATLLSRTPSSALVGFSIPTGGWRVLRTEPSLGDAIEEVTTLTLATLWPHRGCDCVGPLPIQSKLTAAPALAVIAFAETDEGMLRLCSIDLATGTVIREFDRHSQRLLPGEHGFRFFPGFYRHLSDTLSRIKRADHPGSTADNLVATTSQGIALEDGFLVHEFERMEAFSVTGLMRSIHAMLVALDYTLRDITLFQLKALQFVTSSRARRDALDDISWWDYLQGSRFSRRFQRAIDAVPKTLVALDAHRCDAHTQGAIFVQLMLEQSSNAHTTGRVLDGPTSERWFAEWQRYLERRGVRFHFGVKLESLHMGPPPAPPGALGAAPREASGIRLPPRDGASLVPASEMLIDPSIVQSVLPVPRVRSKRRITYATMSRPGSTDVENHQVDYVILATELATARRIVDRLERDHVGFSLTGDLAKLRDFPLYRSRTWMAGIQYFLPVDVQFLRGHIFYPESAWGLSSISQAQFWTAEIEETYGVRGIISVIIGDWDTPVPHTSDPMGPWWATSAVAGKSARQCTRREIADEVWRQLNASLDGEAASASERIRLKTRQLPVPLCFHVDDALDFDTDDSPPRVNALAQYLINEAGTWKLRPGDVNGTINAHGYRLDVENLAICGNHMKTTTRLSTMEAACESARLAVNAILDSPCTDFDGELCALYPMEAAEPQDLSYLTDIDAMLFEMGQPHLFEILGLDALVERSLTASPEVPLHQALRTLGLPERIAQWVVLTATARSQRSVRAHPARQADPDPEGPSDDYDYAERTGSGTSRRRSPTDGNLYGKMPLSQPDIVSKIMGALDSLR